MRALGLAPWIALAAACGGDPQVVLELTGAVSDARHVEVVLLEPLVMAREQRDNDPQRSGLVETVFYMEERSRFAFDVPEGKSAEGLQFEVRDAGGPFVPLVALRRDPDPRQPQNDTLAALGVYNPSHIFDAPLDAEHRAAVVSPLSDVTIFSIQLEPVARAFALAPDAPIPPAVGDREVMAVPCAGTGAISGVVWRRADGRELRVLARLPSPVPGTEGSDGRLDPPDLDCDRHSPGAHKTARGDTDDKLDCDDTSIIVNGSVRERCSALDEDCNADTTLAEWPCSQVCGGTLQLCACDDSRSEFCLASLTGEACRLTATTSDGPGRKPCDSAGPIKLAPCALGCEVLLAWAPEGLDVSISDDAGLAGYGIGEWAPMKDAAAYLSVHATSSFSRQLLPVLLRVRTATTAAQPFVIPLQLSDVSACDGPPAPLVCPVQ